MTYDDNSTNAHTSSVASAGGGLLAAATWVLAKARPSVKPLHPTGDVMLGRLTRTGGTPKSGEPWLDTAAADDVLVRLSRAVGLPSGLPDIHGLAIRVPADDQPADLLLASTGTGRLTRFVLVPSRDPQTHALTTLLPYRTSRGPIFLGARAATGAPGTPAVGLTFDLLWSRGLDEWVPFARLDVSSTSGADPAISFDPVVNPLPGLELYPWAQRLRAPAYRAARAVSGRSR